jgi:hypothetical protein
VYVAGFALLAPHHVDLSYSTWRAYGPRCSEICINAEHQEQPEREHEHEHSKD